MDKQQLQAFRTQLRAMLEMVEADLNLPAGVVPTVTTRPTPPQPSGLQAPAKFYDYLRGTTLLGPKISAPEFEGCEALLKECAARSLPLVHTAYVLGTAYHEVRGTMQPIDEDGGDAYYFRMYDIKGARPDKAKELGNTQPGDGVRFHGRGYPQVTGRDNYVRLGKALGLPLFEQPELLLRADVAAKATVYAMEHGTFTGVSLADCIKPGLDPLRPQFVDARRIVNGTDKAGTIADIALVFTNALHAGLWN